MFEPDTSKFVLVSREFVLQAQIDRCDVKLESIEYASQRENKNVFSRHLNDTHCGFGVENEKCSIQLTAVKHGDAKAAVPLKV